MKRIVMYLSSKETSVSIWHGWQEGVKMPRAFLTLIGLITGYLNGAGLGALFLSFYPGASLPELQLLLIATLIIGPAGAFAGIVAAQSNSFGFQQDSFSERN